MQPLRTLTRQSLTLGARALAERDPHLAAILQRLGPPPMWGRRPGFQTLIRIILEQQVSLSAALTVYRRIETHLGEMSPQTVATCGVEGLRGLGLTRQKAAYCHGLAVRMLDGSLNLGQIARGDDGDGRETLLAVPGLGPWSIDIYYLMALRRPDIWPQGDLALAVAVHEVKGLAARPSRDQQQFLAQQWAPWRSVAARLLWSHYLAARDERRAQVAARKRPMARQSTDGRDIL